MQERFLVLGKAGSGKTHLVLQRFLHYVEGHKEDNVLFILPTHSQVEHIRDHILRSSSYEGYLDTGLVTFSGLATKIVDHIDNLLLRKPLSEREKDLVLSNVLKDANAGYFSEVSNYAGFKNAFLSFVREIKENSLDPTAFKDLLKTVQVSKALSPFNLKCNELLSLYSSYQQALIKDSVIDKEDLLTQALSTLDKTTFPEVEMLLVDGFHDYTQLELKFLNKLSSLIQNVYITLPHQISDPVLPAFRISNKTFSRLSRLELKVVKLNENRRTPSKMLRYIETNIFSPYDNQSSHEYIIPKESLQITVAANVQDEVEQIVRRIKKLTYEEGYTLSQIVIIFRNIEKYQGIVEDTFTRFSIPVRIYSKKLLKENPLINSIINTARIYTQKWQDKAVWKTLKSNIGIDRNIIYTLEQEYLKKGKTDDYNKWLRLASLPELESVTDFLKKLKKIFSKLEKRNTFRHFCDCFTDIVALFYIPAFGSSGKPDDRYRTDTAENNFNREITDLMKSDAGALREFLTIINSATIEELAGGTKTISFEEFIHILESQVDLTSYKKIDRRKEVVNVINVLEARQWEMPVVFLGGLLEKEFPRQIREDIFLKDYYRSRLNATGKIVLREASEQIDEERYLFYIAITRAKERLYLSYPSTNSNGSLTLPSFFLSDMQKLFSKKELEEFTTYRKISSIIPEPEEIAGSTDAKSYVYYHLNTPCTSNREQYEKDIALWLYNNTEDKDLLREELRSLIVLADSYNNLMLKLSDKMVIEKISRECTRFSPTKLKDYAQCPYKYFGRTTLKLRQSIPKTLDLLMQGSIMHKVLEKYFNEIRDVTEIFDNIFYQKTRRIIIGFEELKIKYEMIKTLLAFESLEKLLNEPTFKPSLLEKEFGNDELATLKISDGKKESIELSGKIDRVDISEVDGKKIGLIIDYKYGQTEFKKTDLEEGLDLQLPIYLLALRDVFKIVPVAAEIYALKSSKKTGIYNQELIDNLNLNIKPVKKSLSVDNKEFNKMLKNAEKHILKFAREIRNGRIELAPANIDFCGEGICDFANVCRIDKWRLS
ncbi:ATP-dependent nuclease subunit B [Candidatus Scalindua japonica]|uniref:ATP-dependent nuclease subunit B n=1 Tax=Candidatus Scalindua japonica TaxID=1284222 RepID=A0A286U1A6_9BACT|nr:PD-(D/E)XK nuclease family protein [Candidatus Scalindua japonica]GAX61940.1 ATP-dependent nuclease subunit B [Candidatus Scalindua japonica]